jgi:predicted nucleotidyltransferase component of viral defense system
MIPKAQLLDLAKQQELQPTTVEKDYVLGWLLYAIAQHDQLSRWVFKGGTCLKKCFFETYRFSEDLDFSIPEMEPFDENSVRTGLTETTQWVLDESGIEFPADGLKVEVYENKRGKESIQAKVTYIGPLNLPRRSHQRVKFDLTQDEVIADTTVARSIFHAYGDALDPVPSANCYSVNEILAEKTRALYEREGRARDVYDLVHLSRNFRDAIDPQTASDVLRRKFAFKELPDPGVEMIIQRVDEDVLRGNWENQLAHQLPVLPPVESFLVELKDAVMWWLEPGNAAKPLPQVPMKDGEKPVPRQHFPRSARRHPSRIGGGERLRGPPADLSYGYGAMNRIRYAARNHLCAHVVYHGVRRVVEPYSLRYAKTGNTLLYVYERQRSGAPSGGIKAFKVDEVESATVSSQAFTPQYFVEL